MGCVLRAQGKKFDLDRYLRRKSSLTPVAVHRRGAPRFSTQPAGKKNAMSSLSVDVSRRDFSDFKGQIRDAIRFLEKRRAAIDRLRRFTGVETVGLDFGVDFPRSPNEVYNFPEALL